MPFGTATTAGSSGENLTHYGAIRLRIVGAGNLKMSLISLDDIYETELAELPLQERTNREPRVLSNFIEQRAQLRMKTTEISEYMRVNRIIVFVRPVYTDFPG